MSDFESLHSSSPVDSFRVVWRTGPTQTTTTSISTPSFKRNTKKAGLSSPSSISVLAQGDEQPRPLREQKKVKIKKHKKKKCITRQGSNNNPGQEVPPMDQKTLQLVSQLAMKVHARSQPNITNTTTTTSSRRVTSSRSKSCTELTTPLRSRTSFTITKSPISPSSLSFSSTKTTKLPPPTKLVPFSSSKPSSSSSLKTSKKLSPSSSHHHHLSPSKPNSNDLPPPPPPALLPSTTNRIIDTVKMKGKGKESKLDPQIQEHEKKEVELEQQEEEEEDYDSYFEDFKNDGTLELALSQIEHLESIKQQQQQQQSQTIKSSSSTNTTKTAKVILEEKTSRRTKEEEDKKRLTEELVRKEIESLESLSPDCWGFSEDEDF
ncbi:hypothetical protein JCM5350_000458 [Sporobolomyces pararoseus]